MAAYATMRGERGETPHGSEPATRDATGLDLDALGFAERLVEPRRIALTDAKQHADEAHAVLA